MFPALYTTVITTYPTFELLANSVLNDMFPSAQVPDAITRSHRRQAVHKRPSDPFERRPARYFLERDNVSKARAPWLGAGVGRVGLRGAVGGGRGHRARDENVATRLGSDLKHLYLIVKYA